MSKAKRRQHRPNRASLRNVRIAPRKVRIVADLIRNKSVAEAMDILQFTPKRASPMLRKLIDSAMYNIEESRELDWDIDDLVVANLQVDEGPTLRRFLPRAQGRATRLNKRSSHITVVLQPRA
jgi:large subunit ribosomal protein L22